MIYRKNTVYLDNAASTFPKPYSVCEKMNRVMLNNTANPGRSGHKLSLSASRIIFDARTAAADFFGISGHEENIVFTFNATLAINTVLRGLLKSGDHVIISDVDEGTKYGDSIKKLYSAGILEGDGDGSFRPDDSITRAEAAAILLRVHKTI